MTDIKSDSTKITIKIHIVDDDNTVVAIIAKKIKFQAGILPRDLVLDITTETHSEVFHKQAAEAKKVVPWDLVVTDNNMAETGHGITITETLRKKFNKKQLPIFIQSSDTISDSSDLFSGVFEKPIKKENIAQIVATILSIYQEKLKVREAGAIAVINRLKLEDEVALRKASDLQNITITVTYSPSSAVVLSSSTDAIYTDTSSSESSPVSAFTDSSSNKSSPGSPPTRIEDLGVTPSLTAGAMGLFHLPNAMSTNDRDAKLAKM